MNLAEFRTFVELQVPPDSNIYKRRWNFPTMKIKLDDGQQIDVWASNTLMTEIKRYPYYFMHPEFGVLRNLDGRFVDKSPLCRVLDQTITKLLGWEQ